MDNTINITLDGIVKPEDVSDTMHGAYFSDYIFIDATGYKPSSPETAIAIQAELCAMIRLKRMAYAIVMPKNAVATMQLRRLIRQVQELGDSFIVCETLEAADEWINRVRETYAETAQNVLYV